MVKIISCATCIWGPISMDCSRSLACIGYMGKFDKKRGKHGRYYNYFAAKKDFISKHKESIKDTMETEICCVNCEQVRTTCPGSDNCLWEKGIYQHKRGVYNRYYNHFTPKKESKVHICCASCKYSDPQKECPKGIDDCLKNGYRDFTSKLMVEITKEFKVEYKPTGKALTAKQIVANANIYTDQLRNLCNWILKNSLTLSLNLFRHSAFLPYALKHDCFHDFLLAGGYIEKVDTWIPPKMGDRFMYGVQEFILARIASSSLILIDAQSGNWWTGAVNIIDINNVSKAEFQQICGMTPIDKFERL